MLETKPRIALVSALLAPKFGGPASVLRAHVDGLRGKAQISVFGGAERDDFASAASDFAITPRLFAIGPPRRWFYCRGLAAALQEASKELDIIHAHMIWDHPIWAAWRVASKQKLPLILTPHGSLNQDGRNFGILKASYRKLVLNHLLREVSAVQVLNRQEEQACQSAGVRCPIHVIPNGLPRERFMSRSSPELAYERWPQLRGKRVLLYLGRIWAGKGLDVLPQAWGHIGSRAVSGEWVLVLAGPDYRGYRKRVEAQVRSLGLTGRVLMAGPVYGALKSALLAAASAFVLPSHGEGFSMAVLDALASRLPVLITEACNFSEVAEVGAGLVVPTTFDGISEGLMQLTTLDAGTLSRMGEAGWRLGATKYTLDAVSEALMRLYLRYV